jgi:hypothetical protein
VNNQINHQGKIKPMSNKIASLIDQWLSLDAQARQSGLPAQALDEINGQIISALPARVRAMVIERFRRGGA